MSGPANEPQWGGAFAGSSEPSARISVSADETVSSTGTPYLALQLAGIRCLLPLNELRGVLADPPKINRFPFAPTWLLGVFLFRTELLALVDPLPVLFGHVRGGPSLACPPAPAPHSPPSADSPTILVGGGDRTLAFRVDRVFEVIDINDSPEVRSPTAEAGPTESIINRYIAGMYAPDPASPPYTILAIDPLLDDILGLLAEEGSDG